MAGKSDPSIYDDRTTIGSADELDEYGVWVKSEPQDLSASVPNIEELPDFDGGLGDDMDLPDFDMPSDSSSGASSLDSFEDDTSFDSIESFSESSSSENSTEDLHDDVSLDSTDNPIELEFEEIPENSELPEGLSPTSIDGDGFTEVSMNDFLNSASDPQQMESIDFGDLDSSVPEVESVEVIDNTSPVSAPSTGGKDLSTQLLQRIADELSSIKKEITSLKTELSVVRGEIKSSEAADSKGFFDEEDDEKIALTGDEMDNILNTANFTEEDGSGEAGINFDEDISELGGAIKIDDEIKMPITEDFDISLDLTPESGEDSTELDMLREEGAVPITAAPDDTSYLEEDPLASVDESLDTAIDEQIDFSDVSLDESGFESDMMESTASDPSIDNVSIDLDMEDVVAEVPSDSDDFIFETEETVEIPVSELPDMPDIPDITDISDTDFSDISDISDISSIADIDETISGSDISAEDIFPESDGGIEFEETVPKGLYEEEPPMDSIPNNLKQELKTVLSYMDQLLESLPEEKIEEFAKSEYFETYKKLFEELGLV